MTAVWVWRLRMAALPAITVPAVTWFATATATWHRAIVIPIALAWTVGAGLLAGWCLIQADRENRRPNSEQAAQLAAAITEHMNERNPR
jgi:hypothetical protein